MDDPSSAPAGSPGGDGDSHRKSGVDMDSAMSADDFLPLFTYAVIHAAPPNILLAKELIVHLMDPSDSISERGYYVASLQAALSHIMHLQHGDLAFDQNQETSAKAPPSDAARRSDVGGGREAVSGAAPRPTSTL